jgi:hypothetical protein
MNEQHQLALTGGVVAGSLSILLCSIAIIVNKKLRENSVGESPSSPPLTKDLPSLESK